MENTQEIWKELDFTKDYLVSNLGRIKSLKRNKEKILKERLNTHGYLEVVFCHNGKMKNWKIHQLVMIAFYNHKPSGFKLVINHKNFTRTDNRLENLEIVTMRDNGNAKHLKSISKYTGVAWNKRDGNWRVQIFFNGKNIHLGYFNNEFDGHLAYEKALFEIKENSFTIPKPIYTSKYKGVSFRKNNKWLASPMIDGKQIYLGYFQSEEEAYEKIKNYKMKKHE